MENKARSEMTKLADDSLHKTAMRTISCEEIKEGPETPSKQ